jgi:hypothetical protein
LAQVDYDALLDDLAGIAQEEPDGRPVPEANSFRRFVGHLIGFEAWAADAIERTGRHETEHDEGSSGVRDLDDIVARCGAARRS